MRIREAIELGQEPPPPPTMHSGRQICSQPADRGVYHEWSHQITGGSPNGYSSEIYEKVFSANQISLVNGLNAKLSVVLTLNGVSNVDRFAAGSLDARWD